MTTELGCDVGSLYVSPRTPLNYLLDGCSSYAVFVRKSLLGISMWFIFVLDLAHVIARQFCLTVSLALHKTIRATIDSILGVIESISKIKMVGVYAQMIIARMQYPPIFWVASKNNPRSSTCVHGCSVNPKGCAPDISFSSLSIRPSAGPQPTLILVAFFDKLKKSFFWIHFTPPCTHYISIRGNMQWL